MLVSLEEIKGYLRIDSRIPKMACSHPLQIRRSSYLWQFCVQSRGKKSRSRKRQGQRCSMPLRISTSIARRPTIGSLP